MKNLIISILATKIIMDFPIWEFEGREWILVSIAIAIVLFVNISVIEDAWYKARRRQRLNKRRYERFSKEVIDLAERKKA